MLRGIHARWVQNVMRLKISAYELGLTEDEYMDLARLFADTSNAELESLKSAISANARAEASAIAHSLKGAALNMKLEEFSEIAGEIETAIRNSQWQAADQLIRKFSALLEEFIWAIR